MPGGGAKPRGESAKRLFWPIFPKNSENEENLTPCGEMGVFGGVGGWSCTVTQTFRLRSNSLQSTSKVVIVIHNLALRSTVLDVK